MTGTLASLATAARRLAASLLGTSGLSTRAAAARAEFAVTIVAIRSPGVASITGAWNTAPARP